MAGDTNNGVEFMIFVMSVGSADFWMVHRGILIRVIIQDIEKVERALILLEEGEGTVMRNRCKIFLMILFGLLVQRLTENMAVTLWNDLIHLL